MNYYIQGDAAKAEQIKAAFEELGYDATGWTFNVEGGFYYTHDGRIDLACGKFLINLIKTHPDYKELKLTIEPKFKVGDSLQSGSMWAMVKRIDTENQRYICQFDNVIPFEEQDRWNFVPKKHYAITNFRPFDKVLVRDDNGCTWKAGFYSHRAKDNWFICAGSTYIQCIPFNDDTKNLLGTTDMCDEQYINW